MAKKQGRYFYRNTGAAYKDDDDRAVQNLVVSSVQSESVSVELPQNSRSIPAGGYQNFLFVLYSAIAFLGMLLVIFTWMKPPAVSSLPAYDLIHKPASADTHLKYIEWLVANYRLVDVEHEQLFVSRAVNRGWYGDLDRTRFNTLRTESIRKQEVFRSLVSEYAYWHRANKEYPQYRDGLYRASQLSFMLINDFETDQLLQKSYALDPQFALASEVKNQLKK